MICYFQKDKETVFTLAQKKNDEIKLLSANVSYNVLYKDIILHTK